MPAVAHAGKRPGGGGGVGEVVHRDGSAKTAC